MPDSARRGGGRWCSCSTLAAGSVSVDDLVASHRPPTGMATYWEKLDRTGNQKIRCVPGDPVDTAIRMRIRAVPAKGFRMFKSRRLVLAALIGGLVGLGCFAMVAAGSEDAVVAPAPQDLVTGEAQGDLARFCDVAPCTFIATDPPKGLSGSESLKPGGSSTPLSTCPGAAEVIEAKGYYMPAFGGFEGPCPTDEQLQAISPYTERDALIDQLANEPTDDGERADPAVLEEIREGVNGE